MKIIFYNHSLYRWDNQGSMSGRGRPQTKHVSGPTGSRPFYQKPRSHANNGAPSLKLFLSGRDVPQRQRDTSCSSPESYQSRTSFYPASLALPQATPNCLSIPASACPRSTLSSLGWVVHNYFLSSQALFICTVVASSHPSTPEALTNSKGFLGPSPQPALRCWASHPAL